MRPSPSRSERTWAKPARYCGSEHTPAPPPSRIVQGFDRRLEAVIRTAIRKHPNNRYPAMDIFFDDLGKLHDPDAKLWAGPVESDRYEPQSNVSQLVAQSLGRVIGRRGD